ncbi:hypothetical protein EDB85DRAFT_2158558 [Lactarius pseudohatsudake]|nr:hypothetical protein EDB85DRAFT_2158558 [Lactarius pseudohatsudake]
MSGASALAHAEVDYREGNIDSKIRQHLTAPSQEHSDESSAGFIMAIDLSFAAEIAQSDEVRIAQLHGSDPKKVARLDHIFEQPFHMGPAGDALLNWPGLDDLEYCFRQIGNLMQSDFLANSGRFPP